MSKLMHNAYIYYFCSFWSNVSFPVATVYIAAKFHSSTSIGGWVIGVRTVGQLTHQTRKSVRVYSHGIRRKPRLTQQVVVRLHTIQYNTI